MNDLVSRLNDSYAAILNDFRIEGLSSEDDRFSGVFFTYPSETYENSRFKLMLVGRETAGWNTDNGLGGLNRLQSSVLAGDVSSILREAETRYRKHISSIASGKLRASSFCRFFSKLDEDCGEGNKSIVYANLFAWDYKKSYPLDGPDGAADAIRTVSAKLLAAQIELCKPDAIVFATGTKVGADAQIKLTMNDHLGGYTTDKNALIPKRLWPFTLNSMPATKCYRIAHPRAQGTEFQAARDKVLAELKSLAGR